MAKQKEKGLVFEVSFQGLLIGLVTAIMVITGFFLFTSIITERLSFVNSPYPRQDRAIIVLLSWVLLSFPLLFLAPNKIGLTSALGVFSGLYLGFAAVTGSLMVFDSTDFVEIAVGLKILIAPIYFVVVLVVLLYNAVSGQEFFRSVIFGGVAIGLLAGGGLLGII